MRDDPGRRASIDTNETFQLLSSDTRAFVPTLSTNTNNFIQSLVDREHFVSRAQNNVYVRVPPLIE